MHPVGDLYPPRRYFRAEVNAYHALDRCGVSCVRGVWRCQDRHGNVGCDNEDREWGHEMPFAKQSFTTQLWFTNPAANGMDVRPYENLNEQERMEARRFCQIRYGLDDMKLCFEEMIETRSW